MTTTERTPTWARTAVVAGASLLLGALTSVAQGVLPDALASFANSASGWTLVTVLLLLAVRAGPRLAAVLGATSFVLLTLGYTAASQLRDLSYDPTLFAVVGLLVGPFVGVATSWLREARSWRPATGAALLSGIGAGEAAYGLTDVAETTSPVYWLLVGGVALALLVAVVVRLREARWRLLAVVGTALVAVAFVVAYRSLGAV